MNEQIRNTEWISRFTPGNSSREVAYRIIRDKIIFLELKPGEPLSDKQLAEELSVSRTPVREALIILSTSNMVVLKPQAGTFVAPIDEEWVRVEQFSRSAMERDIINRACMKTDEKTAQNYRKNIEEYRITELSDANECVKRLLKLDNEFHRIAFSAAGHEDNFYHMLKYMQHIERLRVLSLLAGEKSELAEDHTRIAEAVINSDTIAAQYWLDKHLNRFAESLETAKKLHPEYFEIG